MEQTAPHLAAHAETISHFTSSGISARFLIALMEQQSGIVFDPKVTLPFGKLSSKAEFIEQFRDVTKTINNALYLDGKRISPLQALSSLLSESDLGDIKKSYIKLFPNVVSDRTILKFSEITFNLASDQDLFQLPWSLGTKWISNGVHNSNGQNQRPLSSLDFTQSWNYGWNNSNNTQERTRVVAAADGIIKVYSSCSLAVYHEDGFETQYYHMAGLDVRTGDQVYANQAIGYYANDKNQALCSGGHSTGPHLHFSIMKNGVFVDMYEKVFSGWKVMYDINSTVSYRTRTTFHHWDGSVLGTGQYLNNESYENQEDPDNQDDSDDLNDNETYAQHCPYWSSQGFCSVGSQYYEFMRTNCARTCMNNADNLKDNEQYKHRCPVWAREGYCQDNSQYFDFMQNNCAESCRDFQ